MLFNYTKLSNIQHTLPPATMFCKIASFLKKPSQCNYLVTVCGSVNYHCPRHTQDVLCRKTTIQQRDGARGTCPRQGDWFQHGILSMLSKGSWRMGFDLIFIPLLLLKTSLFSLNSTLSSFSSIEEGQFLKKSDEHLKINNDMGSGILE